MKKIIYLLFILLPLKAICQQTISGKIFDANTNKPLVSATIIGIGSSNGATSTTDGTFFLQINKKVKVMVISYDGYITQTITLSGYSNSSVIAMERSYEQPIISVIGSRKLGRTAIQGTVPVEVLPIALTVNQMPQSDLSQVLAYSTASVQSGRQVMAGASDHVDPISIRGMGTDQVLVLVNGKRRHQSSFVNVNSTSNRGQSGTDINAIPVAAIEKIEILKDGAAAQYGSDAIAGIINIVLKKDTNILSGNVALGGIVSSYDRNYALAKLSNSLSAKDGVEDGATLKAALNYGFNLANKGFLNLTGDYSLRGLSSRSGTYTGQLFPSVNRINRDDSILSSRVKTRNDYDINIGNAKITNSAVMFNSSYAVSKKWTLLVFGGIAQKDGESNGYYRYPSIINDNSGNYAAQVISLYPNGFLPGIKSSIQDFSLSTGITGKIANWNTSLSNTLGINAFDLMVKNSINYSEFAIAAHPQQQFYAGGTHLLQNTINLDFTRNFKYLEGLNIAFGAEQRLEQYTQRGGTDASFQHYDPSLLAAPGSQGFTGFSTAYALSKGRNNISTYLDLEQEITNKWMVELAGRYQAVSDFGSAVNYKLGTHYKFNDQFGIRATTSSAYKPPSIQQQYYTKVNSLVVSTATGYTPIEAGTFIGNSTPAQILGIPALKAETAQNFSAGFTATPVKWLDISVDAYLINIKNRIQLSSNFTGGTNATLSQYLTANSANTANFFSNPIDTRSKGIEAAMSYHNVVGNLNNLRLTLTVAYNQNEVVKSSNGNPVIKSSAILASSGQLNNYFTREDQGRIEMAVPKIKGNFAINYTHKKIDIALKITYFGKVTYLDPTINPLDPINFPINAFTGLQETLDQQFAAKTIADLSFNFEIVKGSIFTFGANNLLDVYPDMQTHSGNVNLGRFIYNNQVQQMGANGRYIFGRFSFNIKNKK